MAIQALKKQSDLEKRLQLLRKQVYGKQSFTIHTCLPARQGSQLTNKTTAAAYDDISYLHKDLLKISIFSFIAISTQVLLFFLMKYRYLNINF